MKKFIITLAVITCFAFASSAQCDSTINMKSSKQERLNEKDEVIRSENDVATIVITKDKLVITKDNGDNILDATINKKNCEWKTFLKEGKATYEITATGEDGSVKNAKVVVTAKAGKLDFMIEMADRKIRAIID